MPRPTEALVDLDALRHNCRLALELGGTGKLMAVVKANAYGHGAVPVAQALEPLVSAFAVACIEEAEELRDAGIERPIMLMEGFFSEDELDTAGARNYWVMLQNDDQIEALEKRELARPVTCWLKLDSGMHRLGFPAQRADELFARLRDCAQVADDIVLATHLACADDLESDYTRKQIALFREHTNHLGAPCSLANSPGLLGWPDARADWNRAGVMLYGPSPFACAHPQADKLKQVMTLRSAIIALRELEAGESVGYGSTWTASRTSRIATVPVGYGDGYPRRAHNGTPVLVNGQTVPLAGRVSMDMITVDVTDLPKVAIGDEVILWGEALHANEIAAHSDTIGYEIMTRMLSRVPRRYVG